MFDNKHTKKAQAEIKQCFSLYAPDCHSVGYTHEEKETVKILQTIFSEQARKYTMVLFTFGHLSEMIMKNEGSYYTIKMIAEAKRGIMKTEQCCIQ